ncbi:DUF998 domain-containing protein [Geodermatophilus marinus]|uniref:DUF998 domain-containing protein n=1 Tax=Geodermatophilus sp. LHW52908 TaxID=2303986 RepID=UPI000E3D99BB|nr:DUF998 domain-containing protein [Geodermatophilus sp. LHW52908]RFU20453.1 DUF998 domain-containing protein [Geodermatophilus sp. LHW52908]
MTSSPTRTRARTAPRSRARALAGLLLLTAGAGVLLAVVTAEALYPADYRSSVNTVSDLAAMRPDDVVRQPSAAVFDVTMVVGGLLIGVAAALLARLRAGASAVLPLAALALGMVGVGLFPGNTVMAVHQLVSLVAFAGGGLAAVLAARLLPRPLRPVPVLLGAVALVALVGYQLLGGSGVFDALGEGGTERWIVYPVALSLVVLGSGLAATPAGPGPADDR